MHRSHRFYPPLHHPFVPNPHLFLLPSPPLHPSRKLMSQFHGDFCAPIASSYYGWWDRLSSCSSPSPSSRIETWLDYIAKCKIFYFLNLFQHANSRWSPTKCDHQDLGSVWLVETFQFLEWIRRIGSKRLCRRGTETSLESICNAKNNQTSGTW